MNLDISSGRILIIGHTLRFPNGMGAGARIANYASGFSKLNIPISVIC